VLARQGKITEAIAAFNEAKKLDPSLKLNPEAEALDVAATAKLDYGRVLARQGKITEAISIYAEAQTLNPGLKISGLYWNSLCWYGSLLGNPADVIDACERAVRVSPERGDIRDSRGLARALLGNTAGAIEDFQAYVESTLQPEKRLQRLNWIDALKAGKSPAQIFSEEEKKRLLNQ
jgi:tetratricopeptide (TPR) repeat protein